MVMAGTTIDMFPVSLWQSVVLVLNTINTLTSRSIVAKFLRKVPNGIKRGMRHLQPLIEERIKQEAQYGKDWPDKPVSAYSTVHSKAFTFY